MREGLNMNPGELVRIKRAGIGIPKGTIALITEKHVVRFDTSPDEYHGDEAEYNPVYTVSVVGPRRGVRRYLEQDLEVISGK